MCCNLQYILSNQSVNSRWTHFLVHFWSSVEKLPCSGSFSQYLLIVFVLWLLQQCTLVFQVLLFFQTASIFLLVLHFAVNVNFVRERTALAYSLTRGKIANKNNLAWSKKAFLYSQNWSKSALWLWTQKSLWAHEFAGMVIFIVEIQCCKMQFSSSHLLHSSAWLPLEHYCDFYPAEKYVIPIFAKELLLLLLLYVLREKSAMRSKVDHYKWRLSCLIEFNNLWALLLFVLSTLQLYSTACSSGESSNKPKKHFINAFF